MKSLIKNEFGQRLKRARSEKGLSQTRLGDLLGVEYTTVSRWEHGKFMPEEDLFLVLCEVLEKTPGYFMGDVQPIAPTTETLLKLVADQERRIKTIPDDIRVMIEQMTPKSVEVLKSFIQGLIEGQKQSHQAPEQSSHIAKSKFK